MEGPGSLAGPLGTGVGLTESTVKGHHLPVFWDLLSWIRLEQTEPLMLGLH